MSVKKRHGSSYTVIVGCGRLGAALADRLCARERDVLMLDRDKDAFRKLPPSFGGMTLEGDACDLNVLRDADLVLAHTLLCVTDNDNANIMIALMAREMFGVNKVIARLYDPDRECVYREFGIDTICPSRLSVQAVDSMLDGEESA